MRKSSYRFLRVEAIVPAAGMGLRMKSSMPKLLIKIGGEPILFHTLKALSSSKAISKIIIALNRSCYKKFKSTLRKFRINKEIKLVIGGRTRKDSVENCLKEVSSGADIVLVHDGARPFVDSKLIDLLIMKAYKKGAAISAVPVKSTIKAVDSHGKVLSTPDRKLLWEIQTPQVFKKEILKKAYRICRDLKVTDDASLVERLGERVKVVKGSYYNIKITSQEDLVLAKAILKTRKLN